MPKRIGVWLAVGILLAAPALGYAADMPKGGALHTLSLTSKYTASPWTSEVGYTNRAVGKLGFGVTNLLLGWTELYTDTKKSVDAGDNFFLGLGKGLKTAVEDELGGVVHLVTFPITCLDAPLPGGGTQILSSK